MRRLLLLLFCCGSCTGTPVASPAAGRTPTAATTPSFGLFRLVDHAGEAEVRGDLDAAYAALSHPLVSPSPLPSAPDGAFPRALQVAFAEPELTRLLPSAPKAAPSPRTLDFTWNRTRGVYEAREALFVPRGCSYTFALPVAAGNARRHLVAEIGISPSAPPARLTISIDDRPIAVIEAGVADRGRWRSIDVPLPEGEAPGGPRRLSLATDGDAGAAVFLGSPIVRAIGRAQDDARPNVVFILVDTLRADALSVMPRLSSYAQHGARFTQAVSAATWTRPSLIAALGGELATRLGHSAEAMIPTEREKRRFRTLKPALLPRRLAAAGWDTRAIGNNFFLLGFPRIGLDLGLDAVTDVRHPVLDTPAITAEAVRYLEAEHEAPFFLYLHYDAPHWPYTPPPKAAAATRGKTLPGLTAKRDPAVAAYLGEAAYADEALGSLFDALERTGLAEHTIVAVLGDHGEVFDPAHAQTVEALRLPTLHHHGWSAYDEIIRVPLVMAWPGHIAPRLVEVQTSLVDLAPTLTELAGIPWPSATDLAPTAGRSLAGALTSRAAEWPLAPRPAFIEGQNVRALRADGWLYLRRGDPRLRRGSTSVVVPEELYELTRDPLQHEDRSHDPAAPLETMRARFAAAAPSLPPFAEPVFHLALAKDAQPRTLEGQVACRSCAVSVRGVEHGRVVPGSAPSEFRVELEAGGRVAFTIDGSMGSVELALTRDGVPVDADHLLVGPLALPLFGTGGGGRKTSAPADASTVQIPPERLRWLDAARPPEPGTAGDVLLWRDPAGPQEGGARAAQADGEVATMMRRWGYAQPSK